MPRCGPVPVAMIRERYLAGDKIRSIEFDCNVATVTIYKAICDLPRRQPELEKLRLEIIGFAALGFDRHEIAKRLSCSLRSVHFALMPKPPLPPTPEEQARRDAVIAKYEAEQAREREARASARAVERARQREARAAQKASEREARAAATKNRCPSLSQDIACATQLSGT